MEIRTAFNCLYATTVFLLLFTGKPYLCHRNRIHNIMAKVQLQIKGIEALKKKLMERREIMVNYLTNALSELGERAVTYSKDNKGYQDHTANLKNTIDFALFLDGELVCVGDHKELNGTEKEKAHFIPDAALKYAQQQGVVAPKGYSLVIVSGVDYGQHVENKGYNVLHLTKFFLKDEMKKIILEAVENTKQSN